MKTLELLQLEKKLTVSPVGQTMASLGETHSFPCLLGPPHYVWDRELLLRVLNTRWDPLGIVDLRKLMSQIFEATRPLKGPLEGTVPNFEGGYE